MLPVFSRTGHIVFRAPERMTLIEVPSIVSDLERCIQWCPSVAADLSVIIELDEAAVHALEWGRSHARRHGGDVVIAGLPQELGGLADALRRKFTVYADLDAIPHLPLRTGGLNAATVIPAQVERNGTRTRAVPQ